MKKLEFNETSSRGAWADINNKTIDELQTYFEREVKSNKYFMAFQTQELRFDIGAGTYISVLIFGNEDNKKWTHSKSKTLAKAIAKRIDNKGDNFSIYVGGYNFEFNDLIVN